MGENKIFQNPPRQYAPTLAGILKMIDPHDYTDKCWWCANKADSREHRFKKSDIVREFGRGSFDKGEVVKTAGDFDVDNGLPIQGPNSTYLKFPKNICQKCNSESSQSFDICYDKFMTYLKENEEFIFESKVVNLRTVFGDNWATDYNSLIKYFVKNISTRFADAGVKIEQEIIEFLNGDRELQFFKLVFQIRTDWVEFYKNLKTKNEDYGYVHASGIEGRESKSMGTYYWLGGVLQYRWFQVTYYYDKIRLNFPTDNQDSEIFRLTEDYTITPEEMKENIVKNAR